MSRAEDAASTIERMLVIKALPVFVDVHPDELAVVAEHVREHTFRRGETLYAGAQQRVSTIHLVLEGRVTEYREGRPFVTHGPQRILGGEDALALSGTDVVAVADDDTRTLAIERSDLRDVLEDNFGVLSAALQGVAAATLRLRRRLVPLAGYDEPDAAAEAEPPVDELGPRIAFLRQQTWLRDVQVRTLGQLACEADPVALADGLRLWTEGDLAEQALILVSGRVRCTNKDGRQRFEVGRGTILGLEEALALETRWYEAVVEKPGSALRITRAAIIDVLEDDPDSALEVLSAVAAIAAGLRDAVARDAKEPA